MGKGYEENQERLQQLNSFGKDLARRAKSTCELSLAKGVPLKIYEVPPVPKVPAFEQCLFLSEATLAGLAKPQTLVADEWRHLGELIWDEKALVQIMAYRLLKYFSKEHAWCATIIEEAYLDDEIQALAEATPLC